MNSDSPSISKTVSIELQLEPADHRRLTLLCGPYDDNLKHIERRLLVEISYRATLLRIEGPEPNVAAASLIVKELYQQTENAQHQPVAITPNRFIY
ncbi:nucleoside triphosphate hydrolase [Alishewanella longhuensis]